MNFDLELACRNEGLPFDKVQRLCDLYARNVFQVMVYNAVGSAITDFGNSVKAEITDSLSGKVSKVSKSASGGKPKNPDYAPNRESIICTAEISGIDGNLAYVRFSSCNERTYGAFSYSTALSSKDILELFFSITENENPDLVAPTYSLLPELVGKFQDLSDIVANPANMRSYTYLLDVKRKVANKHEPFEVLSVTPYEAKRHEPGSGTRSDF